MFTLAKHSVISFNLKTAYFFKVNFLFEREIEEEPRKRESQVNPTLSPEPDTELPGAPKQPMF